MALCAVVSPRACANAALSVVAVSLVAFTVWVLLVRDVCDFSSTSTMVSVVSWFGFSPSSLSSPPICSSTSSSDGAASCFVAVVRDLTFLASTFLGSVSAIVSRTLSSLVGLMAYGPFLLHCGSNSDYSFCYPTVIRLHSSLTGLVAQRLPFLAREHSGSYILCFAVLATVLVASFKFWLYHSVVPSFRNVPMDQDERQLVRDLHWRLALLYDKCSTPFCSLSYYMRLLLCSAYQLDHLWLALLPIMVPSIVVDHQLCFKPDIGIVHCQEYPSPLFSRFIRVCLKSLATLWHNPSTWSVASGLASAGIVGYLVYWHALIYLVVRAYFSRKAGRLLTAVHSVALVHSLVQDTDASVELDNSVSLDDGAGSDDDSFDAGRIESSTLDRRLIDTTVTASPSPSSSLPDAGAPNDDDVPQPGHEVDTAVIQLETPAVVEARSSVGTSGAPTPLEEQRDEPALAPPPIIAPPASEARQYSPRFPEGYHLAQELIEEYELTSIELEVDVAGFRLSARSRRTGDCVTIKFFSPHSDGSKWIVHPQYGRIPYEVFLAKVLAHQNIVSALFVFGDSCGWFYLVQETGIKLTDFIANAVFHSQGVDMARFIFTQLVAAVSYLHQNGIAHGDLRLDNVVVTDLGEVKLAGLPSAKSCMAADGSSVFYESSEYQGQDLYAPPEVLADHFGSHYSPSHADMWTLGVILFELVLGYSPFATNDQIIRVAIDGHFPTHLWSPGDAQVLDDIGISALLGLCCLQAIPASRSTIEVLKSHEWLRRVNIAQLPSLSSSGTVTQLDSKLRTTGPSTPAPRPVDNISYISIIRQKFREHFSLDPSLSVDFLRTYSPGPILGVGGFGCVIKARHRMQGHEVAFKFIRKQGVPPVGWTVDEYERALPLEVKLMTMATHENIARSLEVFQDNDFFYIGVELHGSPWILPSGDGGNSLHDFLNVHGQLSEDLARYIFGQIVEAIHYLHSIGISHGDLKPANVLIDDNLNVKLIDLGNAVLDDLSLPMCEHLRPMEWYCGTPVYMPPECFLRNEARYAPTDVWSLGILLIELLTCTIPFYSREDVMAMTSNLREDWHEGLSNEVGNLITGTCLAYYPESRGTIEDVRAHPWLVGWRAMGGMIAVVKDVKMEKKT